MFVCYRICRMRCQYLPQRLLLELTYDYEYTTTTTAHFTPPPKPSRYCSPPRNTTTHTTTTTSTTLKNSLHSLSSSNFPPYSSPNVSPRSPTVTTTTTDSSSSSSSSLAPINKPNSRHNTPSADTHQLSTGSSHDAARLRPNASSPNSLSSQECRTPPFYLDNTSTAQCPSEDNMPGDI